ncbi:MAG: polyketide synthase, partial [Undibacterium sp.]|nr:polyketide synthase [Undibacterium sp.]
MRISEQAKMAAVCLLSRTKEMTVQDKVKNSLVGMVSSLIEVRPEDIDGDTALSGYGFDSISLTKFAKAISDQYKIELTPTIFFEYPTLDGLANYLVREHAAVFAQNHILLPVEVSKPSKVVTPPQSAAGRLLARPRGGFALPSISNAIAPSITPSSTPSFASPVTTSRRQLSGFADEPVAIIGMSGQFPMAGNIDEFWQALVEGKDCISEIPTDRWDWQSIYGDPNLEENKSNIKWGGFIDGIADFDPLFFGISPKEAELMDPQQRLMMLHIWKALEDAGYAGSALSGSNTGIYVGTIASGYANLISRANVAIEGFSATGSVSSVGPNRMSYFLDFHGPSEPVETACSSSLVALRRAVLAIRRGECGVAIVGGVNTIVTPDLHISFNKAGMLSEDGRCKTFSSAANGYVRGEGVGMVVLKALSAAERDGDHIYGVVRGTAENHGGRASSLTAPNPKAQAAVVKRAYQDAGIDPRTITYIEAHGTGTSLGDPIEINGLKAAFKELYSEVTDEVVSAVTEKHCGLGSAKSNFGHLELAAGIVGVIKVLLQMKHKTLVKSLHCESVNPYIHFDDSPFYVVQEARPWTALSDANGKDLPRRAGVSSFGFGGVNAHIVLEEYIATEPISPASTEPVIVLLSARKDARLQEQAQELLTFISERQTEHSVALRDLAYTLQVGREAMEVRLALVVNSFAELRDKLTQVVAGVTNINQVYRGQILRNRDAMNADEHIANTVRQCLVEGRFGQLLDLWVTGYNLDWNR